MLVVASPALTFPSAEVSLGEVVAGDVGERVVELGNSGDAALHVSKERACCGASAVLEIMRGLSLWLHSADYDVLPGEHNLMGSGMCLHADDFRRAFCDHIGGVK